MPLKLLVSKCYGWLIEKRSESRPGRFVRGMRLGEDLGNGRIVERTLQVPLKNRIGKKGGDGYIV